MQRDKCVLCTIGTSIANGCDLQREYFKPGHPWDEDTTEFEKQIRARVAGFSSQDVYKISAEINSLERLGLTKNSKVILLATDNAASKACANELKVFIKEHFGLADQNVEIKRIKGLQVHNVEELKRDGFRELVTTVLSYLRDDNLNYQCEVVLNPTGGYKGVIPFLIVLGMLYGKRSVYIFEHAEQLISLPPLPFTFDIEIYNRVAPALRLIDEKTAISEQEYYANIIDYTEQEKTLFASFVEPIDDYMVTISPLAEVLLSIENRDAVPMVSRDIIQALQNDNTQPALALKRLIKNSVNPLWRKQHSEKWHQTNLIVIKQNATAERLAGFIKDDVFYVAYAFRTHEAYERDLPKYNEKTAQELDYAPWEITENVGQADTSGGDLIKERDHLLVENNRLMNELESLNQQLTETTATEFVGEKELNSLRQEVADLNEYIKVLEQEQKAQQESRLNQQNEQNQALIEQQAEIEESAPKAKGFVAKLIDLFKRS